jgi:streptogramin lyase
MIVEPQTAFRATLDRLSLPAIILLIAMPGVSAQTTAPSELHGNYIRTRFGMEQGLYSNQVDDIVQSADGLLFLRVDETWISHFDGQHFDVDQPGKLGRVSTLEIAPNGDLWVGRLGDLIQVRADNLSQFGDWPFARYQLGPDYTPIVLRFTHDGVLWVGTNHGLYRFDQGKLLLAIPGSEIERIEEEGNGRLWITTKADVMEVDGAHVLPHPELASLLGVSAGEIFHVFEDSHSVTWFCTRKGVARRVGGTIEKLQPWGSRGGEAFRIYEDPRGRIWFAKGEGLFQLTTKGLELVGPGMNVRQMHGDRDGSLWVSTNGDGLYRFKDSTARTYTTADGLPSNIVMTVLASRDESIWAGFNCGGIAHFVGREFRIYNEKDGLLNSCVWSLAEDANHDLWIGTWGGGVFRFHQGKFIQYSTAQGLPDDVVRSVIAARDGSVWLALRTGVSRIRDGRVRNYTKADGLSSSSYVKVHEDRTGGIWAESRSKLERLVGDRFEQFSPQGSRDQLYLTGEDATGAMYFTALSPGGEVATYRFANNEMIQVPFGLDARASSMPFQELSQLIWEMRETSGGDIWTFSSRIARFRQGSLKRAHGKDDPLDFETFGSSDGLPMTQPSSGSPNFCTHI